MAIPDFEAYATPLPAPTIGSAIQQGLQTYEGLKNLQMKRQQMANLAREQALRDKLLETQTQVAQQKAAFPLGSVGGNVGQRLAIYQAQRAGLPPNVITDLKNRYNATTARLEQMANYYGLPAIGKAQLYEHQLTAQAPTGNLSNNGQTPYHAQIAGAIQTPPQHLTPQQQFKIQQVRAAEQKLTSDPDTRKQVGALDEIVNQYNSVPFDQIKQYAGVWGLGKRGLEAAAAIFGKESPSYDAYQTFVKQSKGMADQLRKALGTSIRSQYVKTMLLPLINTIDKTWANNPRMAQQQWQWLGNWLKSYRASYTKMVEQGIPTNVIKKMDIVSNNPELQMAPPGYIKGQDGQWYTIQQLKQIRDREKK